VTSSRRFRCKAESVSAARRFVRDVLREQPRETVEAAELMTSELATNSVRHAHSDFELAIHCSQRDIRIEVSDSGQGQPTLRSPTPHERSGRGLRIVQELSDTWGTVPSTNGKTVWFTLPTQLFAKEHEPRSTAGSDEAPGSGTCDAGLLGSAGFGPHFAVQDNVCDGHRTLALSGELDLAEAAGLTTMIARLCADGRKGISLDLSRLTFTDSSGPRNGPTQIPLSRGLPAPHRAPDA
jgi:anti-sigma regulatory factor (Ser/Thr protein kinase)